MTDRFSHLLKSYNLGQKKRRILQQMNKSKAAVEINGNGSAGLKLSQGPRKGKILAHLRNYKNKI
tara:strand:- start:219 stop:413 length:195 start_codon:yes stop_codon:yes gene_type:complete